MVMHKYHASRKRARLRWRHSDKGKAWDKAYYQRDEVKKRRHEWHMNKKIKDYQVENTNKILIEILNGILITDGLRDEQVKS